MKSSLKSHWSGMDSHENNLITSRIQLTKIRLWPRKWYYIRISFYLRHSGIHPLFRLFSLKLDKVSGLVTRIEADASVKKDTKIPVINIKCVLGFFGNNMSYDIFLIHKVVVFKEIKEHKCVIFYDIIRYYIFIVMLCMQQYRLITKNFKINYYKLLKADP